jgi:hypothetical protein
MKFICLDNVQFARRTWQQRNRIKTVKGPQWLTAPVSSKGRRDQLISEVLVEPGSGFDETCIRAIESNYSRDPRLNAFALELFTQLRKKHEHLTDLNIDLISWVNDRLGDSTPCLRRSSMKTTGSKADLLAAIAAERGADSYLSAPGSREYLSKNSTFADRGIEVLYHEYEHPIYAQNFPGFEPHLSVVDLLLTVSATRLERIRSGIPAAGVVA